MANQMWNLVGTHSRTFMMTFQIKIRSLNTSKKKNKSSLIPKIVWNYRRKETQPKSKVIRRFQISGKDWWILNFTRRRSRQLLEMRSWTLTSRTSGVSLNKILEAGNNLVNRWRRRAQLMWCRINQRVIHKYLSSWNRKKF